MSVAALVLAAGRGERAGGDTPKQYALIGGIPVIRHTVAAFLDNKTVSQVVLVIHRDDRARARQALGDLASKVILAEGGATRQDSTYAGLQALQPHTPDFVHIHDGARPFIAQEQLEAILHALSPQSGVLLALPVSDTLKQAEDGYVRATIPREGLYAAQTPQSFPYPLILAAHQAARTAGRHDFTDDSTLAEWHKIPMKIVAGSPDNMKITWSKDIIMADQRLNKTACHFPDIRTGNGYDVHRLEDGAGVILCGVHIPWRMKLSGHSDADVGLHALTDALLATHGAGDIGTHFPPSDPQWKGAASDIFVRHAVKLLQQKGGRIANVDITLIAEAPKIGPHRAAMTAALQDMLGIQPERISIKATTNEQLGFIGRGEGISAIATATVIYPGEVPA
ncbi:MAG: Bifunctional enzyme IspD/IspF [Candidatus Tokpelaia hoelldobleri]|uniref:Bifunctional enzyme IspD/IspF n=1 Tax=Candidatus Tokpelaia hoelldobleri TaxID=1902579 RepID=A0A1U9JU99_9HYPH|nr:MAG: Bifunctional enzyme IspD/IspF [Candidatus Tokpelaia hoelldoblerii]